MVFLSPKIDLVFKKLFGTPTNKEILIAFLNSILDRKQGRLITDVTFSDTNNYLKILEQKCSIVDVRCTDQQDNNYIVEMQVKNQHDFVQRAQYYGACGLDIQLQPSEKYNALMPVIFVGIVDFNLFKRHKRYLTHHYFADNSDHGRDLQLLEFHFIELPKFKKTVQQLESLDDKWIYFLKNAENEVEVPAQLEDEKPLKAAFQILTQSAWTREELTLYQRQVDAARVEASVLDTAKIEGFTQGHAQGHAEGHAQGLTQGLTEGRAEGRAEGQLEEKHVIARTMLTKKIPLEDIAEVTGLSVDVIKKLKKN